jgi:hypothetical protein
VQLVFSTVDQTLPVVGSSSSPTPEGASELETKPSVPLSVCITISPAFFALTLLTVHSFPPSLPVQPVKVTITLPSVVEPLTSPVLVSFGHVINVPAELLMELVLLLPVIFCLVLGLNSGSANAEAAVMVVTIATVMRVSPSCFTRNTLSPLMEAV